MAHWRTINKRMNPAFMYAEDIGEAGTTLDVEIIGAGPGTVVNPGGKVELTTLVFSNHRKKLGLNATNCKSMVALTGSSDFDQWRGWITLVVIHKEKGKDPTVPGGFAPMDVIVIAPERPARGDSSAGDANGRTREPDHPLVARFDACSTRKEYVALDAEMRADWERIPKGAARTAVSAAFDRAKARLRAAEGTPSSTTSTTPDQQEQDEILRKEASERR